MTEKKRSNTLIDIFERVEKRQRLEDKTNLAHVAPEEPAINEVSSPITLHPPVVSDILLEDESQHEQEQTNVINDAVSSCTGQTAISSQSSRTNRFSFHENASYYFSLLIVIVVNHLGYWTVRWQRNFTQRSSTRVRITTRARRSAGFVCISDNHY